MYNKAIIEFSFCDIRNNQGLGKCNQPRPLASADYTCLVRISQKRHPIIVDFFLLSLFLRLLLIRISFGFDHKLVFNYIKKSNKSKCHPRSG